MNYVDQIKECPDKEIEFDLGRIETMFMLHFSVT